MTSCHLSTELLARTAPPVAWHCSDCFCPLASTGSGQRVSLNRQPNGMKPLCGILSDLRATLSAVMIQVPDHTHAHSPACSMLALLAAEYPASPAERARCGLVLIDATPARPTCYATLSRPAGSQELVQAKRARAELSSLDDRRRSGFCLHPSPPLLFAYAFRLLEQP